MKKSELKNIIKECVKEVIFEEGVLSNIIAEVATGLSHRPSPESSPQDAVKLQTQREQIQHTKKEVLAAVGRDSYAEAKKKFSNPALFEGTTPIPSENSQTNPLAGTNPADAGVKISSIPGFSTWGAVANSDK